MELPTKGGATELKEPGKARPKRKRLRYFVAFLLVCLVAATIAVFASGPVRVPMLGSLLAMQGTRGPVTLSVDGASLDFTARDGINIILEGAEASISGPSAVTLRLPKLTAPLNRDALFSGKVHFSSLILDQPHVEIELKGGPAKIPEIGPLMEAVDRVSDVVDDQFARRALKFVSVTDASVELSGATKRKFTGIDANVFREVTVRSALLQRYRVVFPPGGWNLHAAPPRGSREEHRRCGQRYHSRRTPWTQCHTAIRQGLRVTGFGQN